MLHSTVVVSGGGGASGGARTSGHAPRRSSGVTCHVSAVPTGPGPRGIPEHIASREPSHPLPGTSTELHHVCVGPDGSTGEWISTPAPAVPGAPAAAQPPSAAVLAAAARQALLLPLPTIHTAPPPGPGFLVGFPVWVWTDPPHAESQTRAVPGLSATVTATPAATTFSFDDGTAVRCPDGGTPWRRGLPGSQQHSDCTHTFDHHGTRTITATTTWHQVWQASDGTSGTYADVTRTTTAAIRAWEAQAVIDH